MDWPQTGTKHALQTEAAKAREFRLCSNKSVSQMYSQMMLGMELYVDMKCAASFHAVFRDYVLFRAYQKLQRAGVRVLWVPSL